MCRRSAINAHVDAPRPITLRSLAQLLRAQGDKAVLLRYPEPLLLIRPFERPPAAIRTPRSGLPRPTSGTSGTEATEKLGATQSIDPRGATWSTTRAGATPAPTPDPDASLDPEQMIAVLEKSDRNPFAEVITVGRARSNDVALDCPEVSKVHAWIRGRPGAWRVSDNGSTNGTFLQSIRIEAKVDHELRPGMAVRFGPVKCRLVTPDDLLELCAAVRI